MTREKEIEILMKDGCTKSEAIKHLEDGAIIFTDLEENFIVYSEEWDLSESTKADFMEMFKSKKPLKDWGIVEDEKTYYIQYFL